MPSGWCRRGSTHAWYWSRPPAFESAGGGLVSTADDYLAFSSALLADGTHHGERVLSRPSVTLMTSDHLTPAQKAVSGFTPEYFFDIGWGFGMSVRTQQTHLGPSLGSYGWPGLYGIAWYNDPAEDMTTILMMQRVHEPQSLVDPARLLDGRLPGDRRLTARVSHASKPMGP